MTDRIIDTSGLLKILSGVERQYRNGDLHADDAIAAKLEILKSEFDGYITGKAMSPLQALGQIRKINSRTLPHVEDRFISSALASSLKSRLISYGQDDLPQTMTEAFAETEENVIALQGVEPIRTYCKALDESLGSGLYPTHTLCLTGHEGSLKTSLAIHMLEQNVWNNSSVRALFCSLDMVRDTFTFRRVSRFLNVHEVTVREMSIAKSPDYLRAKKEIEERDDGRLSVVWAPLTIQGLQKQVERTLPNVIFIDYITCLKVPGESDQFRALQVIVEKLRDLREQANAAIVFLSQMSRASKIAAKAGQPGNHAFGGSIIEHLLDVEFEMVLDEPTDPDEEQKRLIVNVTKNRFGPQGMAFELEYLGVAKKITGRAWKIRRDANRKPAYGSRVQF